MSVVFEEQLELNAEIADFLSRHDAQAHFSTVCNLVRECLPELSSLEVSLQADPDEDGRVQAVLCARLPESITEDRVRDSLRRYHERVVEELPLSFCPLFALITCFVSE